MLFVKKNMSKNLGGQRQHLGGQLPPCPNVEPPLSTPTGIDKQVRESLTQNSQFSSHVIYFYIYLCLIIHYAST
jgi:hypothetical protein